MWRGARSRMRRCRAPRRAESARRSARPRKARTRGAHLRCAWPTGGRVAAPSPPGRYSSAPSCSTCRWTAPSRMLTPQPRRADPPYRRPRPRRRTRGGAAAPARRSRRIPPPPPPAPRRVLRAQSVRSAPGRAGTYSVRIRDVGGLTSTQPLGPSLLDSRGAIRVDAKLCARVSRCSLLGKRASPRSLRPRVNIPRQCFVTLRQSTSAAMQVC